MVNDVKIDFDRIFTSLNAKSNSIYYDNVKLQRLIDNAKTIAKENKTLGNLWSDIKLTLELVKDWIKGDYKEISKGSIIMIIGGLLYLVNPIDIIPDFLIAGFLDDAAVLGYLFKKISLELDIYRNWNRDKEEEEEEFVIAEDEEI